MGTDSWAIVGETPGAIALVAARAAGPWSLPLLVVALTLPMVAILTLWWRRVRETTLVMPLVWIAVSLAGIVGMSLWAAVLKTRPAGSEFAAWQFVLACGTFCPFVAVIGAKRPQHLAWNLVVFTLWGMLALPAAEVLLLQPGQALEINSFRSWFLVALMFAQLANFGLTKFGSTALVLVIAQGFWLWPYLPIIPRDWHLMTQHSVRQLIGFGLLAIAMILACRPNRSDSTVAFDRLWFDFRDSFGLFWALRLMERVNDTAIQAGWNFDLGWGGFRTKQDFAPLGELPAEIEQPLRNTLTGLLRRFMSEEWIAERLDQQQHPAKGEVKATS